MLYFQWHSERAVVAVITGKVLAPQKAKKKAGFFEPAHCSAKFLGSE
jgi:hypothetical protein